MQGPLGPRQSGGDGYMEEEEEEEEEETEEGTQDEGKKDAQEAKGSPVKIEESSKVVDSSTIEEVPKEVSQQVRALNEISQ